MHADANEEIVDAEDLLTSRIAQVGEDRIQVSQDDRGRQEGGELRDEGGDVEDAREMNRRGHNERRIEGQVPVAPIAQSRLTRHEDPRHKASSEELRQVVGQKPAGRPRSRHEGSGIRAIQRSSHEEEEGVRRDHDEGHADRSAELLLLLVLFFLGHGLGRFHRSAVAVPVRRMAVSHRGRGRRRTARSSLRIRGGLRHCGCGVARHGGCSDAACSPRRGGEGKRAPRQHA
mmetsp:Transcript_7401/g.18673  ORF Transcript_7401/g.18673 Transcript_7401/m.18673 type:complete len:231 (+) Transcript_7401:898-1590(+)